MTQDVGWLDITASLVLVAVTVALALWFRLGVTRAILVAAARAASQLIAVGYLINYIVDSDWAQTLAWLWVGVMVIITAVVARRRAPDIPGIFSTALAAIGTSTAVCLAVIFGLGIMDLEPLPLVVIAGITIGNTMPAVVLATNRVTAAIRDDASQIEALLSLGFDLGGVVRFFGGGIVRTALVPQIERTNVVGLIALLGAMTGLLLAGMDPIQAVLLQLVVMYLVLGSATMSVVVTVILSLRRSFTADLRLIEQSG